MLRSILIGLPSGARSLAPLAVVADAARRGALRDRAAPAWLASLAVGIGLSALAAGELWGDKLPAAPDRTVPAGLIGRLLTAGLAGAALAPKRRAWSGAALGAATAVASAYLTFALRSRAMRRFGQTRSGLVEDALTLVLSRLAVQGRL